MNNKRQGPGDSRGLEGQKTGMASLGPVGEKGEETEDSGSASEDP